MIWGAAAVIEDAYDGINLLNTTLTVSGARAPVEFLERQMEQIRTAERLHAEEVHLEAVARGLTVAGLLAELQKATHAIVDLKDLEAYQEDLAWELYEQGVIRRSEHKYISTS